MGDRMNFMRSNPDSIAKARDLSTRSARSSTPIMLPRPAGPRTKSHKDKAQVGFPRAHVSKTRIVDAFEQCLDRGAQEIS